MILTDLPSTPLVVVITMGPRNQIFDEQISDYFLAELDPAVVGDPVVCLSDTASPAS